METTRQKIESLFAAALELKDSAGRAAFLDRECADDAALRRRVERLLSAHGQSKKFFADCQLALLPAESGQAVQEIGNVEAELGRCIGPYKLLQKIGEGGCGVVYMAEQEKPVRRRVARKVIKLGMDTKSVIARFEAERQALALMDHPNIARVLDASATETGRPYFVMELVPGVRITEYCDQTKLDTGQRLKLFVQVCHAIQHAHQKGVIHRDIKPSNILVTLQDGLPVPKVIDFGIAKAIKEKLTDKTLFTICGNFIGTPAYMSPEQAEYSGQDIDTRSDIYSLGVLLYELLTGKPPFDQNELLASGLDEMRKTLREREPHRPSTKLDTLPPEELTMTARRRHVEPPKLQLLLRGDLDWIVMKALEKDRRRRYETANGLAMDVQRFLANEPVLAHSPSRWYRFQKLVRRNRGLFAATGAVALALVVGFGTASWLFFKEREMRHRAVAAEQVAEQARANETELRRLAETREKITQATLLISQQKMAEADQIVARTVFNKPTTEGAAVLRALGVWHALNGRWQPAADHFLEVLRVNQLDGAETIAKDFLPASVALVAADEPGRLESFRHDLAKRLAAEKNLARALLLLKAGLVLPSTNAAESLQALVRGIAPAGALSIGSAEAASQAEWPAKLRLQNIGTEQPCSLRVADGLITMVGGGGDIFQSADQFAFAFTSIQGGFDYRLRVRSISPELDEFTRVGLMARESLNSAGSRHVMVAVNANGTFQVVVRSAENTLCDSLPANPLPLTYGSNSWVRLQRVGAIFHAYTSSNGVDWAELYATAGRSKTFNDQIYFGIAACAHSTIAVATNLLSGFGVTPTVSPETALTVALCKLRAGEDAAAAEWCRRLLAYPEIRPVQAAAAQAILAQAGFRLGHRTEAQQQLESARQAAGQKFTGELDWLFVRELVQQAARPAG